MFGSKLIFKTFFLHVKIMNTKKHFYFNHSLLDSSQRRYGYLLKKNSKLTYSFGKKYGTFGNGTLEQIQLQTIKSPACTHHFVIYMIIFKLMLKEMLT